MLASGRGRAGWVSETGIVEPASLCDRVRKALLNHGLDAVTTSRVDLCDLSFLLTCDGGRRRRLCGSFCSCYPDPRLLCVSWSCCRIDACPLTFRDACCRCLCRGRSACPPCPCPDPLGASEIASHVARHGGDPCRADRHAWTRVARKRILRRRDADDRPLSGSCRL